MEKDIFVREARIFRRRLNLLKLKVLKKPLKSAYFLLCSVEFELLPMTVRSILDLDPGAVICVIANSTRSREEDYRQMKHLDEMFEADLIHILLYNSFSSATNLAKQVLKETVYLQLKPYIDDETWMIYTDPDMPFKSFSIEQLEKEYQATGVSMFGYRGGYFDWESPNINEYIRYGEVDSFVYPERINCIACVFATKAKDDININLTEGYYPLFWFDDTDKSFRLLQNGGTFGLFPRNWVDHIPHSASGKTPSLFAEQAFYYGKQRLKKEWYDTGKIKYIAPVESDSEFTKEGVKY